MPGPSVDLLALLRPDEVAVTVAGRRFPLTARTAAQWIGAIAMDTDNLYGLVPGLIEEDDLDAMYELGVSHPDIETRWFWAARTALGRGAGRDWWWARNLTVRTLGGWAHVNGMLLRQGISAKSVSYPDWLDACYSMLWANGDEEARTKLDLELSARPRGIAVAQSRQESKRMAQAFAAD